MDADPRKLKADRFALRQYVRAAGKVPPGQDECPQPLAWYPLLVATPEGRVTVPGVVPANGKTLRLILDAQGEGRIESCELTVK